MSNMITYEYEFVKTEVGIWVVNPENIDIVACQICPDDAITIDKPIGDYVSHEFTKAYKRGQRNPFKAKNKKVPAVFDTLCVVLPRLLDMDISELDIGDLENRFSAKHYHEILSNSSERDQIRVGLIEFYSGLDYSSRLKHGFKDKDDILHDFKEALPEVLIKGITASDSTSDEGFQSARLKFWEFMQTVLLNIHFPELYKARTGKPLDPDGDIDIIETTITRVFEKLTIIPSILPRGGYFRLLEQSVLPKVRREEKNHVSIEGEEGKNIPDKKTPDQGDAVTSKAEIRTYMEIFQSLIDFIIEFFSDRGEADTFSTAAERNAWTRSPQNLYMLMCRYLEDLEGIDLRTGRIPATVSTEMEFNKLKNESIALLRAKPDDETALNAFLQPPLNRSQRGQTRDIYEIFSYTLGKSKKKNTQTNSAISWQLQDFTVIFTEWLKSLKSLDEGTYTHLRELLEAQGKKIKSKKKNTQTNSAISWQLRDFTVILTKWLKSLDEGAYTHIFTEWRKSLKSLDEGTYTHLRELLEAQGKKIKSKKKNTQTNSAISWQLRDFTVILTKWLKSLDEGAYTHLRKLLEAQGKKSRTLWLKSLNAKTQAAMSMVLKTAFDNAEIQWFDALDETIQRSLFESIETHLKKGKTGWFDALDEKAQRSLFEHIETHLKKHRTVWLDTLEKKESSLLFQLLKTDITNSTTVWLNMVCTDDKTHLHFLCKDLETTWSKLDTAHIHAELSKFPRVDTEWLKTLSPEQIHAEFRERINGSVQNAGIMWLKKLGDAKTQVALRQHLDAYLTKYRTKWLESLDKKTLDALHKRFETRTNKPRTACLPEDTICINLLSTLKAKIQEYSDQKYPAAIHPLLKPFISEDGKLYVKGGRKQERVGKKYKSRTVKGKNIEDLARFFKVLWDYHLVQVNGL